MVSHATLCALVVDGVQSAFLLPVVEPVIKRLDGPRRAMVLAALAGLIILGFAMVLLTWLGARYVRRMIGQPARPTVISQDDWAGKPLVPGEATKKQEKET
jgi:hypothetical protein